MTYPFRVAIFLALAVTAVILLNREDRRGTFETANRAFRDWLVGNASGQFQTPSVTLIGIDRTQLHEDGLDPRLDWAFVLRSLEDFEPRALGIVPPVRWETADPLTEGALRKRILLMPEIVAGTVFGVPSGEDETSTPPDAFTAIENVSGDPARITQIAGVVAPPDEELLVNGRPAFTHIELQEEQSSGINGIRVPLLARYGDRVVPSFVLQLIMLHDGIPASGVSVSLDGPQPLIRLGDAHVIPIDGTGHFTVYHGIRGRFPSIAFSSLALSFHPSDEIAGKLQEVSQDTLDSLRSNAVIIGYDEDALRLFSLPGGDRITRAELLSMATATIQSGRHIRFWPVLCQILSWAALLALGALILLAPRGWILTGAFVLTLLYAATALLIFQSTLSWATPWIPLAICALLALLGFLSPSRKRPASTSEAAS